ncbi:MAG: endonuclease [Shewanella sp.]|uniref:endonuclease n=1 Tax=unclassified Shewanella TaxID=196818 RepID=UPI0021D8CD7B|nr:MULTISPECIES: endonuclease [unclassified Shewanella]MCU8034520.1 endonuclease [Shewanella sp. SM71]MCU8096227.1 endonuclease [Shewanella sp. SM102]
MRIKMSAVATATAIVLGTFSTAASANLVITEYIEGSANNKAIEISNLGSSDINLDANAYKLILFANGADASKPGNTETLTGTLAPGKSIVFHNAGATIDAFKLGSASTVTYFNGDDAVVLTKNDVVIDRFGKRGEDPGTEWKDPNNADFSSVNKTLRRKASVTTGDTVAEADFPGTNNQWAVFVIDTADGLGCPGEKACTGDVTPPEPPKPPEPETGPCTGCETLTPVADPATFNSEIYYSDVLSGEFANAEELKNALSVIIAKNHKQLTYKQVWSTLTYADQDPANDKNVIEIYTGASISKYDNQTGGSGVGKWNREHVWAKSHGFPNESQWGYTDAHHLRPSDVGINTARSNNDFGACKDTGEEVLFNGAGTGNYLDKTTDCWEPRDKVKGDVARMIMYMDTRYQGTDTAMTQMPDLVAVDRLTTTAEDDAPLIGTLCTLYEWSQLDAVDSYEQNRNNQVYKYQGNRNPFIDRPELVKEVYGAVCGDDPNPGLVVEGEIVTPESVTEGAAYTLDASAIKAGEGVTLTYKWEQIVGEEKTLVGNQAILSLTAPKVKADDTLNFTLTISNGTSETTKAVSLSVMNVPFMVEVGFAGNTKLAEEQSTTITATVADAPVGTTYSWKQVSGTTAKFTATDLKLDVTAPKVDINQSLVFELTVTNADKESFSKSVSIEVLNTEDAGWTKPDGAGSLGGFITLLLPLIWLRRRQG